MLTPQEVSERAFQKASFGGYNMSQVDEFLDVLTGDYSTLYTENAVLKSKMKVLVDKVEEYRATEEAMRKALMTAQRMADDLVKEAEQKKAEILQQAEGEVLRRKQELCRSLEAEEFRLQKAQQTTLAFVEKVRALQAGQEKFLSDLQNLCPEAAVSDPADPVEETADEIDDNVQRLLAQAMMDATSENLKSRQQEEDEADLDDTAEFSPVAEKPEETEADEEDPPPVKSCRIDFGTLQFGRDYEIK